MCLLRFLQLFINWCENNCPLPGDPIFQATLLDEFNATRYPFQRVIFFQMFFCR